MSNVDHLLHRARLGRGLSLPQVVQLSLLPAPIAERIDEGRFDELPPGIYARSYVRSFAVAVGLEAERALEDVAPLLPAAPDPFPVMRELKGARASRLRLGQWLPRSVAPLLRRALSLPWQRRPVPRRARPLPRWVVATVDAAMLLALNALVVVATAYISGLRVGVLLQHSSAAVATVCVVPMAMYFVLFEGIAGRTLGAIVCKVPESRASSPLRLRTILLRAIG